MPFTGNREFKANPRLISGADGVHYLTPDGRRILDGLSGLWCCGAGHNRREIADAIAEQARTLDYAPAFQFGHPKAFELASRLRDLTPAGLDRVFFVNSGSEAADTSLKIARAYWRQRGRPGKTRLIGRAKGYHGVNFGGIAVGGIGPNRRLFGATLETDHLAHTLLPENTFTRGQPAYGAHLADELEELVALHDASNIAAVIVEPFAGSAGVIPPPQGYLERLRAICDRHDILLIFDEVITGFGRCGARTGADFFGVTPDIANFAKQITNGAVPMGAVVVKKEIYDAFMEQGGPHYMVEFPHGYTYSGHPLACAAALAALDLFESEGFDRQVAEKAGFFEDCIHGLANHPHVLDVRNLGFAGALTLASYQGEPARRPYEVAMYCWQRGLYVRYGGDTLQFGPAFVMEKSDIAEMFNIVGDALRAA
ncbi:MAG: aspartate aminotransferase family protein [Pseudomonadales bacterium]|nr:aspartate aminotransferase family protein [Pseudomonadales bacterium]